MTDTPNPDPTGTPASGGGQPPLPPTEAPAAPAAPPVPPQQPAAPQPVAPQPQTPPAPAGAPAAPAYVPAAPGGPQQPPSAPQPAPPAPGGPQPGSTNTLAIVSLVASFFIGIVGIICGHIALGQIKRTGQSGRGLALAGTIIGYVQTAIVVISIIASIVVAGLAVGAANNAAESLREYANELPSTSPETPGTETPGTETPGTETPGGDGERSTEFCEIFAQANGSDSAVGSDGKVSAEALELFKKLAETPSPNQDIYERFYVIAQDPTQLVNDEDPESLLKDYVEAATKDATACAS